MRRLLLLLPAVLAMPAAADLDGASPESIILVPSSVRTVFVAETSTAAFHRFEHLGEGGLDYRGHDYMSIGENGAGKERSGDRRTPLGIYFVTEQLDTSRMHEKYGITAFVLDYPNAWDQRLGRSGDGIWVHGVDRRGGKRPKLDTDGCIALPNEDLVNLEPSFKPNRTPVVVAREIRWTTERQLDALRTELKSALHAWARTLKRGELDAHLALYDDEFRHWGLNKSEWGALQRAAITARAIAAVDLRDLLLLADPEEDGLFLSRFQLEVREASGVTTFTKRLYWRRNADGELKIVAEGAG